MRNIAESDWLGNPVLDVIKTDDKNTVHARRFTLRATQIASGEPIHNAKRSKQK